MAVAPKDSRLDLRVDSQREGLIRHAAELQGRTVTDFVLSAAAAEAERVLADRTRFALDDGAWNRFNAALERPVTSKPALRALLQQSSVLERE
jgi:uncharacterized protein (DUF1778 family)